MAGPVEKRVLGVACWGAFGVEGMTVDTYPVRWQGRRAVVTLPDHIDVSNAGQIREELLSVINLGADELIADLGATVSCDHAGAEAVARAYQRAAGSGTQLRLVIKASVVRRLISVNGLDRVISIYPTLEAAVAAAPSASLASAPGPAPAASRGRPPGRVWIPRASSKRGSAGKGGSVGKSGSGDITMGALSGLIDAFADGVALVADDGEFILVNRALAAIFGYKPAELTGQRVEALIPDYLRAAHLKHRGQYLQAPRARPMAAGTRLVGLCKNGATVPVEISLSPVPAAAGVLTFVMAREVTRAQRDTGDPGHRGEHARPPVPAATADVAVPHDQGLLERAVQELFHVGLTLQQAHGLHCETGKRYLSAALADVDNAIQALRDHSFSTHG